MVNLKKMIQKIEGVDIDFDFDFDHAYIRE